MAHPDRNMGATGPKVCLKMKVHAISPGDEASASPGMPKEDQSGGSSRSPARRHRRPC